MLKPQVKRRKLMKFEPKNKIHCSLLLYLETCSVEYTGRLDMTNLNGVDKVILEGWVELGYVESGRIKAKFILQNRTRWVKLSLDALKDAHEQRRLRTMRVWNKKSYETTTEVAKYEPVE